MNTAEKRSKIRERLADGRLMRGSVAPAKILGSETLPRRWRLGNAISPVTRVLVVAKRTPLYTSHFPVVRECAFMMIVEKYGARNLRRLS